MMSEQKALTIEAVLDDRFRVISEGRQQDLGIAFRAHDLHEDRLVELLVLSPQWGRGQQALDRLKQVQETVRGLSIPGLIASVYTGIVNGQIYLIRPPVAGQTLAALLARDGRLDKETAVALAIRLCEMLAPVHGAGLTHGSLSTHAVVLKEATDSSSGPEILVLDTGILPALRPTSGTDDRAWGRLPYISPEQASGQGVHPPSDVYVIGALLYEMLIGRPPFRATDETVLALQHLHQEPPSLQIMDTSIPKPLTQIVYRTLDKEPSARYRNAGQLAHVLRAHFGPQPEQEDKPEPAGDVHLLVPPPPLPTIPVSADVKSGGDLNDREGDEAWGQHSRRIDWVMVVLLIVALIAVLGLVPLWTAVYSRYASATTGWLHNPHQLNIEPMRGLIDSPHPGTMSKSVTELEGQAVVWYNTVLSGLSPAPQQEDSLRAVHPSKYGEESPGFGVQLTGWIEKA
jgi:serine/threonine protein kinase